VQYRSILDEPQGRAPRRRLFDAATWARSTSAALGRAFSESSRAKMSGRLYPGACSLFPECYPTGGVVDDLLVYLRGPEDYFLCINAGNIDKDLAWIREQAAPFNIIVTTVRRLRPARGAGSAGAGNRAIAHGREAGRDQVLPFLGEGAVAGSIV